MQNKTPIPDKVEKDKNNRKKYKIMKDKDTESDVIVELTGDGDYIVERLSLEGLPKTMNDGLPIRWFNSFAIRKNGQYINEKYFVTIPDGGASRLVIFDGNGNPYYYTGEIKNHTIELTDGDPAGGWVP